VDLISCSPQSEERIALHRTFPRARRPGRDIIAQDTRPMLTLRRAMAPLVAGALRSCPACHAQSVPRVPRRNAAHALHLSPEQVGSILRASEYSYVVPEFDGKNVSSVLGFESNQLAANSPAEDRRAAASCLQTGGMLFGVFDGHAGSACAQALSERLFYYVAVSLLSQGALEEIEDAVESRRSVAPILEWHKHPYDFVNKESAAMYFDSLRTYWQQLIALQVPGEQHDIGEALASAFRHLDSDLQLEAQVGSGNQFLDSIALRVAFSGSTACVAHVRGCTLTVANAGDCRAVLGRRSACGSEWQAVALSRDHDAQNPSETSRLRAEHPSDERNTLLQQDRLLGMLTPLRAFGDVKFKWSAELQRHILERGATLMEGDRYLHFYPPDFRTPPYLTAEPELCSHILSPEDSFLVLASDGLWELLDDQEVVRVVGDFMEASGGALSMFNPRLTETGASMTLGELHGELLRSRREPAAPERNAATLLVRHAVGRDEAGRLCDERLCDMLSLPEDLARLYRDDITVTVVVFNPQVLSGELS